MVSGRGLGHTGGTLDKLESIPGFNVNLTLDEFRRVLTECGCGLIGQTAEIAPADKKLYALRDVTGTVESPNLIAASICSKKLAEGIDSLVLDVKCGSGAFMKRLEDAEHLATLMVDIGKSMGKRVVALITEMSEPLGWKIGNSLEIEECIEILRGELREGDLYDLCLELAAWMLVLGEKADSVEAGKQLAQRMISSGRALAKFRDIIRLQGGDEQVVDDVSRLPHARYTERVVASTSGYITLIHCEQMGIANLRLGGGREKKEDSIDPAVGIVMAKKVGDFVQEGDTLCTVHYNSETLLVEAKAIIEKSFVISSKPLVLKQPLVRRIIGAEPPHHHH